jgi:YcaO-like protein with predicted kinase domain
MAGPVSSAAFEACEVGLRNCPLTVGESFAKVASAIGRIAPVDAMDARTGRLLDRVPITRIADISPLDTIGSPVFVAVTPLARDLTTHMGKGLDEQAARVSATMEAIERVSAEAIHRPCHRASFSDLCTTGAAVADPQRFDLPSATTYREDLQLDWTEGWDLMTSRPIWIPADLARSPSLEGVLDQADTNGLAAGATYGEAIRHALLECIERDAVSQHLYYELFGDESKLPPPRRRIDAHSLSDSASRLVRLGQNDEHEILLDDLTGDLGVPVVCCNLLDHAYPTTEGPATRLFCGWGADTTAEAAVVRAVTEAYQSKAGVIQGARDSFNVAPKAHRRFTKSARQKVLDPSQSFDVSNIAGFSSDDISVDVDFILSRLAANGLDQVIVIDLMDNELDIPVVRVRVPGLSLFVVDHGRPGWRCARHLL